ncbi:hypothetical protein B0J14DRAFT_340448 [Halenospora varia]|nr:hypothetical protein B0J14DRAFT_340448 [Halenospora varia]
MNNTTFTPPYTDPAIALQQMYELDAIQWQGGDNHFDGPHDTFCFLCASPNTTSSLFSCSTCENCYHAECMTPSLSPDDVPRFWFCPHCVERGNHVPDLTVVGDGGFREGGMNGGEEFIEGGNATASNVVHGLVEGIEIGEESHGDGTHFNGIESSTSNHNSMITPPQENPPLETRGHENSYQHQMDPLMEQSRRKEYPSSAVDPLASDKVLPKPNPPQPQSMPPSTNRTQPSTSRKRSPPPPPSSSAISKPPPKKKSKYSTLPSALEKALLLITTELEKSSSSTSSTSTLQSQITTLEQKIRMMEGQAALKEKEVEKRMEAIRKENERLKGEVDRKEGELKEWKGKLRGLVGD